MPGALRTIVGPVAYFECVLSRVLDVHVRGAFSPRGHCGSGCSGRFLGGFEWFLCGALAQGFEQSVVELCVVF